MIGTFAQLYGSRGERGTAASAVGAPGRAKGLNKAVVVRVAEPEPVFFAGAGAVILPRLRLRFEVFNRTSLRKRV